MKKLLLSICLLLVGFTGYAQDKGDMAAGITLGVAPSLEKGSSVTNFGIGAKYQYNVLEQVRLEGDLEYWFKDHTIDVFDISANVQYLFPVGSRINIYPTLGIGYAHIGGGVKVPDWAEDYVSNADGGSGSRFLFNLGVGVEYAINYSLKMGLEIKYQYLKDFGRLPIQVGVTYQF